MKGRNVMAYDKAFYEKYLRYLAEPAVRKSHDFAFRMFRRAVGPDFALKVIDLGCGTGEYERHGPHTQYVGIDENESGYVQSFLQADYADPGTAARLPFEPNAFVSLFSIEPFFAAGERYALYERLFARYPKCRFALVSGFYYQRRAGADMVTEKLGGSEVVSYQTIEDPSTVMSSAFTELRMLLPTPSSFGDDVVEVWKILLRQ